MTVVGDEVYAGDAEYVSKLVGGTVIGPTALTCEPSRTFMAEETLPGVRSPVWRIKSG